MDLCQSFPGRCCSVPNKQENAVTHCVLKLPLLLVQNLHISINQYNDHSMYKCSYYFQTNNRELVLFHSLLLDQHVVNMVTASKTHFMASTAVGKDRFLYMPPVIRENTGTHRHQCIEERNAFRCWSPCILWKKDIQPLTGPPSTRCCWEVLPGGFLSSSPWPHALLPLFVAWWRLID